MDEKNIEDFIKSEDIILESFNDYYFATEKIKDVEFNINELEINKKINQLLEDEILFITKEKLIEIVSAILSGKHIILYGPPGTGKTTIAKRVADIFNCDYDLVTATSDWSTYHTVGGLKIISKEGKESFEPVNGCIVDSIIKCCNYIGKELNDNKLKAGNWLIIDELNRADMDKAFGQVFTALDPDNSYIQLHFHNSKYKKELFVPKRFRIIGTMNNYDKDFLYHISYALMRRFSYIYIGIPMTESQKQNEINTIKKQVVFEVKNKVNKQFSIEKLDDNYSKTINDLQDIIYMIRPNDKENNILSREIGFAQYKDTLKYVVIAYESLSNEQTEGDILTKDNLLDMAITSNIVPQLEGLNKAKLKEFSQFLEGRYPYLTKTLNSLENYINNTY